MLLREETSTFWNEKRKKKPSSGNTKNVSAENSTVCSKIMGKTEELKFKAQSHYVGNMWG